MAKQPKIPPHNEEAEELVLGSMLIDSEAVIKVTDILVPKDFYNPKHSKLYEVMLDMFEKRKPIDMQSVSTHLKDKSKLKALGGASFLASLTNKVTTAAHVDHYANIVKEKKILRDLIRTSSDITQSAFNGDEDIEDFLDKIEQEILAISQHSVSKNFTHIKDELKEAYERIENIHQGDGRLRGITTGFKKLNDKLSGFQRSDLVILGARPSTGKTSLALDLARHAALDGASVGYFSIEMSREQIIDRIIAQEAEVPLWKLRTGGIKDDMEFQMIQATLDRLSKINLFVDDSASPNILQMRSMARRLQVERGLDIVFVDYLQLINPRDTSQSMVQQITDVSRGLKALARELNVPVVALSQLSRDVEKRGGKPRLSDLRESGSIEQDADLVLFLSRKKDSQSNSMDLHIEEETKNIVQLIIAKHRNGPPGTVDLYFDKESTSFKEIDDRYEGQEEPVI